MPGPGRPAQAREPVATKLGCVLFRRTCSSQGFNPCSEMRAAAPELARKSRDLVDFICRNVECLNSLGAGGHVRLLLVLVCLGASAFAQAIPQGVGQGYDGELSHVTSQLLALAEATPAAKFAWRPSPGVRSTSEVYMHIAIANFYFLNVVGKQKMPSEITQNSEKSVTT